MNDTTASAPGASLIPDWTGVFTTTHLVFIAVLALLVIAGMIFGARLAHRRRVARAELERHNAEVARQEVPPPLAAPPAPLMREAAPAPVSPVPATPPAPPAPHAPVITVEPTPPAASASAADGPVTQLKGLGPKVAARLGELGITTVGQLAALTDDDAAALDAQLGPFAGRMGRDRWQEQARFLAAGDIKGFEAVFGRL